MGKSMIKPSHAECPPLLFFDSGIGGLSVLRETIDILPHAPIVYAADYAGLPYGMKSEAELAARVPALLGRLVERYKPILVTIACNTASTIALGMVRDVLHIPIVGTVPAIKPAAALTKTGTIGLLGTAATIRQGYVDDLEARFANDKRLIRHAAPALVGAAETKLRGGRPADAVFAEAVAGLRNQSGGEGIDTVVLACTHFPLIEPELRAAMGPGVTFVDGAQGIARRIASLTQGQDFAADEAARAIVTGELDPALTAALAPYGISEVTRF